MGSRTWIADAERTLRERGAEFVRWSNAHQLWRLNGVSIVLPSSPSDVRSQARFRSDLRRALRAGGK